MPYEIPRDVGVSMASAARMGLSRGVSPAGLKRERVSLARMRGGAQEGYTRVCALGANNADGPRSHGIRFTQSAPLRPSEMTQLREDGRVYVRRNGLSFSLYIPAAF